MITLNDAASYIADDEHSTATTLIIFQAFFIFGYYKFWCTSLDLADASALDPRRLRARARTQSRTRARALTRTRTRTRTWLWIWIRTRAPSSTVSNAC